MQAKNYVRASVGLFWLYSRKMTKDCCVSGLLSGGATQNLSEKTVDRARKKHCRRVGQIFEKLCVVVG